jgi:hypothetical protein
MKKQTAVKWLVEQLPLIQQEGLRDEIKQAKEMEKEQHEMTFNEALNEHSSLSFEKYYEETFEISFFI